MPWPRFAPLLAVGFALLHVTTATAAQQSTPNIILIIGDDIGWTDFGFMGSKTVKTPNLDRLAEGGTVFTHAFSTASNCRPALRTLLTGLAPETVEALVSRARPSMRRRRFVDFVLTLPEKLAEQGYVSFQGGKHWEGTFQDAGFTHGMTRTIGKSAAPNPGAGDHDEPSFFGYSGSEGLALGRETMEPLFEFLAAPRDSPFFVWYAPKLPHLPFDPPQKFKAMYADAEVPPYVRGYWANMTRFDATVGALMERLDVLHLREQTLIVYVSDNGWDAWGQGVLGGPKGKSSLFELGFRTPLLINWPGRVAAGVRDDRLVSLLDVFPTLADFAGAERAPGPGQSLHPLLMGGGTFHRETVTGSRPRGDSTARFLRTKTWRYVSDANGVESLYQIEIDPREERDLAAAYPELVAAMRDQLRAERRAVAPPRERAEKRRLSRSKRKPTRE